MYQRIKYYLKLNNVSGIIRLRYSERIGEQIPSAEAVIILSRYFQVSTDYLLKVTDDSTMIHRIDDFDVDLTTFSKRLNELRKKFISKRTGKKNIFNSNFYQSLGKWKMRP